MTYRTSRPLSATIDSIVGEVPHPFQGHDVVGRSIPAISVDERLPMGRRPEYVVRLAPVAACDGVRHRQFGHHSRRRRPHHPIERRPRRIGLRHQLHRVIRVLDRHQHEARAPDTRGHPAPDAIRCSSARIAETGQHRDHRARQNAEACPATAGRSGRVHTAPAPNTAMPFAPNDSEIVSAVRTRHTPHQTYAAGARGQPRQARRRSTRGTGSARRPPTRRGPAPEPVLRRGWRR